MSMEFKELDRLFSECYERIAKKGTPGSPYSAGPLASDHFLLGRSWSYFKERIKSIESHWKSLLDAKTDQNNALKKEILELQRKLRELAEENKRLASFEQAVVKTRMGDFISFNKDQQRLRLTWEQERQTVEHQLETLRFQLIQERKRNDGLEKKLKVREKQFQETVAELKKENSLNLGKEAKTRQEFGQIMIEKDERIRSLDSKIDLLKSEIERRDQLLKNQLSETEARKKSEKEREGEVNKLKAQLDELHREHLDLKTRLDLSEAEKASIRSTWQKEQAQWRELWERGRDLWEHGRRKSMPD